MVNKRTFYINGNKILISNKEFFKLKPKESIVEI